MEESAGFYLNDLGRITALRYIPTDDDVLRARLKTLGVVEHSFMVKGGGATSKESVEWRIYDVGGARQVCFELSFVIRLLFLIGPSLPSIQQRQVCVVLRIILRHQTPISHLPISTLNLGVGTILYRRQCNHLPCTHLRFRPDPRRRPTR